MFISPVRYLNKPFTPVMTEIMDMKKNMDESIIQNAASYFKNSDDVTAFQNILIPSTSKFRNKEQEKRFDAFFEAFVKHHLDPESKLDYKGQERAFFNLYMNIKMLSYDDLTQQFGKTVEENTTSFLETGVQKFEKTIGLNLKKLDPLNVKPIETFGKLVGRAAEKVTLKKDKKAYVKQHISPEAFETAKEELLALLTQKPKRSEDSELLTKEPFLAIKKEIQKELGPQLISRFAALLEKSREKKEPDDDDKEDLTIKL